MTSTAATKPSLHWPTILLALAAYVGGVVWRFVYIVKQHDPRWYIESDMAYYVQLARRMVKPDFVAGPYDVTHPPAMSMLIAAFLRPDNTISPWAMVLQLVVACLVPLAVGWWGWLMFGPSAGLLSLAMASLYFPFVDYGGYFLAEIYVALMIPVILALYLHAARARTMTPTLVFGAGAGAIASVALAFKLVVLPGIGGFLAVHLLLSREGTFIKRMIAVVALVVGMTPGTAYLSHRATRANNGQWCLVSNKGAADFLLGHYGRIHSLTWLDPANNARLNFGSPAAVQRGYTERPTVYFSMTDQKANEQEAWAWIRNHPGEALVLSLQHVHDLFFGSTPWPSVAMGPWALTEGYHYFFMIGLLAPSIMLGAIVAARLGVWAFLRSSEFLTLTPLAGVMLAAFIATGEPRYRIPWDSAFIILAMEFYRRAVIAMWSKPQTPPLA